MTANRHGEIYGVTTVHISRWKAAGNRKGIPCPLDYPEKMPDWWMQMVAAGEFQKGVPFGIQSAAARIAAATGGGIADREPVELAPAGKKWDYAASLELAERNANAVQAIFDKAIQDGNDAGLVALQRTLNDALDSHRALSRDRGKIQLELGEVLPKEDVRAAMLELHSNIARQFRQGIKQAFADLPDLSASRESWSVFADALVDKICLKLTASDFAAD
jgi:hypothetical protein